jgi:DNA-binding CsgD family transcriptional regulator
MTKKIRVAILGTWTEEFLQEFQDLVAVRLTEATVIEVSDVSPTHPLPPITRPAATGTQLAGLTGREHELLLALCEGLGNDQLARKFDISRRTVEFHLTGIFKKLNVASRAEAMACFHRFGMMSNLSGVS